MNYLQQKLLGLFVKTNGVLSKPILSGLGHIFMMHRVLPDSHRNFCTINKDLAITPDYLEFCLDYFLKKNYVFISLNDLYDILINKKHMADKFVCLTFDDGYIDNLDYAYPLLKKRGIPFAVYVTNCFPNRTGILWWYWLEKYMAKYNSISLLKSGETKLFKWANFEESEQKFHLIRKELLSMSHKEFIHFCKAELKINEADTVFDCTKEAMSWTDLQQISADSLVTIGAHTMNHIPLAAQSKDVLLYEIKQSKVELEQKLSKQIDHFAYPYGSFAEAGQREYNVAKEIGFKTATVNYPGNIFSKSAEALMFLPRMPLGNITTKEKLDNITNGITHYSYNGFSKIPPQINAS